MNEINRNKPVIVDETGNNNVTFKLKISFKWYKINLTFMLKLYKNITFFVLYF